jgi:hypothetical protein
MTGSLSRNGPWANKKPTGLAAGGFEKIGAGLFTDA